MTLKLRFAHCSITADCRLRTSALRFFSRTTCGADCKLQNRFTAHLSRRVNHWRHFELWLYPLKGISPVLNATTGAKAALRF